AMHTTMIWASQPAVWWLRPHGRVEGYVAEGLVGVGAQRRDGGDADHHDQCQHHGVLDRRRAAFTLQELQQLFTPLPNHLPLLLSVTGGRRSGGGRVGLFKSNSARKVRAKKTPYAPETSTGP